ncbi:MAG: hypothetical protein RLZZ282_890 [Verrucomicrobiota bacterium]
MSEIIPPAPESANKNGLPVLAWVGIGCGTIVVIAVIAISLVVTVCKRTVGDLSQFKKNPEKVAAELMVRMNPDLKMISQDEATGEMTVRTKDGEELTMCYKDISAGKFVMKDAKGNVSQIGQSDLSNVPEWVPRIPQLKIATASFNTKEDDKVSGLYSATTAATPDALAKFFKTASERLNMTEANRTAMNSDGVENLMLSYQGDGRSLHIVITGKPGEDAQVNVGYEQGP